MKSSASETIAFLESHHLFHGVPSGELAILFPFLEMRTFAAGDVIIQENSPGEAIYVIASGAVQVTKAKPGKGTKGGSIALNELGKGDTFGEMGLLEGSGTSATVTAKQKTSVLVLSAQAFQDIFEIRPNAFRIIMLNLARDLSRRLRAADARIAKLSGD
jgi:CRP-like cAMP-binding protein